MNDLEACLEICTAHAKRLRARRGTRCARAAAVAVEDVAAEIRALALKRSEKVVRNVPNPTKELPK